MLEADDCRVFVRADHVNKTVDLGVSGPGPYREAALNKVRSDFDRVHEYFVESKPTETVPLPTIQTRACRITIWWLLSRGGRTSSSPRVTPVRCVASMSC